MTAAEWNDADNEWTVRCDTGQTVRATYCVMASGCLSVAKQPDFPGLADFRGEWYHTGRWPHHSVDFAGKTVAVIGTDPQASRPFRGSPPLRAPLRPAANANYSMPAQNRPPR